MKSLSKRRTLPGAGLAEIFGSPSGAQRQETFSCVDPVSWLAVTVMVPVAVFLFLALTWTVALCPASSVPCAGETVSVGGDCACQVKEELPRFLTVSVAIALSAHT